MSLKSLLYSFLLLAACALPGRAALLISEVVFNEVGSDTTGEWIEIYNSGAAAIDLTNYKIGDEETSGGTGTGEAMHHFPAGAFIGPGEVQIVAVSATRFQTVYGFLPTYEATSTDASVPDLSIYAAWDPDGVAFNMANTNDHALILGPSDEIIDAVNWGNNTFLNPGLAQPVLDGQAYQRINPAVDTDSASDWELVTGDTAAARSTPGTVPVIPEPTSALIAIAFAMLLGAVGRRR